MGGRTTWRDHVLKVLLILIISAMLAPVFFVVLASFNNVTYNTFPPKGFSLRWYENVFKSGAFIPAFFRSLRIAAVTAVLAVFSGVLAAFGLVRFRFWGSGLVRNIFLTPIVTPKIIIGLSSFMLALQLGLFGSVLSLILCHSVITVPYVIAVTTAALLGLDPRLEEAAADLGARGPQVMWRIVLPQVRLTVMVSAAFAFLRSFDQVNGSIFLVRPGQNTLPIEMFLYLERFQDPTIAAVSSLMILLVVAVMGLVALVARGTRVVATSGSRLESMGR